MKKRLLTFKLLMAALVGVLFVTSCTREHIVGSEPNPGSGKNGDVTLSINVPGRPMASTKAIAENSTDDYQVDNIIVLLFDKNTGLYADYKISEGSSEITGGGSTKSFKVSLSATAEYNAIVLANCKDIIADASGMNFFAAATQTMLKTKEVSYFETNLNYEIAGKWNANPSDGGYIPFPMSSVVEDVTVSNNRNYTTNPIRLNRMVAKINLSFKTEEARAKLNITEVRLCNYNTKGNILSTDWDFTKNVQNQVVNEYLSRPTAGSAWDGLVYSGSELKPNQLKVCTDEIFLFEAAKPASENNWIDGTCLLIKGTVTATNAERWYRVNLRKDFGSGKEHFNILRNYRYEMIISDVVGNGHGDEETAYNSIPEGLEINIVDWNDGKADDYEFNGQYYMKFEPKRTVRFTQFGTPDQHEITVRTNAPKIEVLESEFYSNFPSGQTWTPSGSGENKTYDNTQFTVVSKRMPDQNDERVYTFTITAKEIDKDDVDAGMYPDYDLLSQIRLKAFNLFTAIQIEQDAFEQFKLSVETDPVHTPFPGCVLPVGGDESVIKMTINSTHDYTVALTNSPIMLDNVYSDAACTTPASGTISKNTTTLYVKVKEHTLVDPRVASITIKHVVSEVNYVLTVVQTCSMIEAKIGSGYVGSVSKDGGNVTIKVTSNMNEWEPVLALANPDGTPVALTGTLADYFPELTGLKGALTKDVKFVMPPLVGSKDIIATIHFKDAATGGTKQTVQPIVVTQTAVEELKLFVDGVEVAVDNNSSASIVFNAGTPELKTLEAKWSPNTKGVSVTVTHVSNGGVVFGLGDAITSQMITGGNKPYNFRPNAGGEAGVRITKAEFKLVGSQTYIKTIYLIQGPITFTVNGKDAAATAPHYEVMVPFSGKPTTAKVVAGTGWKIKPGSIVNENAAQDVVGMAGFALNANQAGADSGNGTTKTSSLTVTFPLQKDAMYAGWSVLVTLTDPTGKVADKVVRLKGVVGVPRITWGSTGYEITVDPTDAGLYFKYGSVVGIYSANGLNQVLPGSNSDSFDAGDVPFNISDVNFGDTYASVPYAGAYVNIDDTYHTVANVKVGKGDPCRLVGINLTTLKAKLDAGTATATDIDNSTWRLPTMEENKTFSGQTSNVSYNNHWWTADASPLSGVAGGEFKDRTNTDNIMNFLPAAGYRTTKGVVDGQGKGGYYWSSTPYNASGGFNLYFSIDYVFPEVSLIHYLGFTVRCVAQ